MKKIIKSSLIIIFAVLQVAFYPGASYALEATTAEPAAESTSTVAPPESTGPVAPTGADGSTFIYNDATGLWENDYYTWNPTTKQTSPKGQQEYSYNPDTQKWDTNEWLYDAPSGKYVPNVVESTTKPAGTQPIAAGNTQPTSLRAAPTIGSTTGPSSPVGTTSNTNNATDYSLFL